MRRNYLLALLLLIALLAIGCSKNNNNAKPVVTTEETAQVKENTQIEQSATIDEINPALELLQTAQAKTNSVDNVGYTANLTSELFMWDLEDPGTKVHYSNTTYTDGSLRRETPFFSTREQLIFSTNAYKDEELVEDRGTTFVFGNYYGSEEDGLFYKEDEENQWYKLVGTTDLSSFAHIDKLFEFFTQHPDQLTMKEELIKVEEECCGSGPYEYTEYTVNLNVTGEAFMELIPYLHNNFFGGGYDPKMFDDDIITILDSVPLTTSITMTIDEEYYIDYVEILFESLLQDKVDGEYYSYEFFVDFYAHGRLTYPLFMPEEVINSAIEYSF